MRKTAFLVALALAATAPAFAGDLTGFRITKQPESPCKIHVTKVVQEANGGYISLTLRNETPYFTKGKVQVATKAGTNMVMDGSDFKLEKNGSATLVASKNPRGVVAGKDVMIAFTECTVAMN